MKLSGYCHEAVKVNFKINTNPALNVENIVENVLTEMWKFIVFYYLVGSRLKCAADPMKKEIPSSFLDRILFKLRPLDLKSHENQLEIKHRVKHLLAETGLTSVELGKRIRQEIHGLRSWLSDAHDLTIDTLHDLCLSLHISLGDLVLE